MNTPRIRVVEGVVYQRYLVRFTLRVGEKWMRRKLVHYSPGIELLLNISRGLDDYYGYDNIKPRSVTVTRAP